MRKKLYEHIITTNYGNINEKIKLLKNKADTYKKNKKENT